MERLRASGFAPLDNLRSTWTSSSLGGLSKISRDTDGREELGAARPDVNNDTAGSEDLSSERTGDDTGPDDFCGS